MMFLLRIKKFPYGDRKLLQGATKGLVPDYLLCFEKVPL
jgi:hypothetical protein